MQIVETVRMFDELLDHSGDTRNETAANTIYAQEVDFGLGNISREFEQGSAPSLMPDLGRQGTHKVSLTIAFFPYI